MEQERILKGPGPSEKCDTGNSFFDNSLGYQWQQCAFVCTSAKDAWYPPLLLLTLCLHNILLFLLSQFYEHSTKTLAFIKVLQRSYCNIVFLIRQFKTFS